MQSNVCINKPSVVVDIFNFDFYGSNNSVNLLWITANKADLFKGNPLLCCRYKRLVHDVTCSNEWKGFAGNTCDAEDRKSDADSSEVVTSNTEHVLVRVEKQLAALPNVLLVPVRRDSVENVT